MKQQGVIIFVFATVAVIAVIAGVLLSRLRQRKRDG
jgi:hypothetical protein